MKTVLRIALYGFTFVAMVLLSSYLTFRFMGAGKTVEVPDLRGKSLLEASRLVASRKLYLKIEAEEYSSDIPEGHVISQNIPPSRKIKEGRTLRVIVSKGPKILAMPSFVGLDIDEARELARKKNIRIQRIIKVHSDNFPRDTVVAQRPSEDEKGSDVVTLLVSRGPYEQLYVCPDFTEMTLEEAKIIADRIGVEIELDGYGSRIVAQKPAPGSIIKSGDILILELQYSEEQELRWL